MTTQNQLWQQVLNIYKKKNEEKTEANMQSHPQLESGQVKFVKHITSVKGKLLKNNNVKRTLFLLYFVRIVLNTQFETYTHRYSHKNTQTKI